MSDSARSRPNPLARKIRQGLNSDGRPHPVENVLAIGILLTGLAWLILTGTWPAATVVLVLTNDLIWWIPFAVYLRDAWPLFRREFPATCKKTSDSTEKIR